MTTEEFDKFGRKFRAVEPASIGLPKHTLHTFRDDEPTLERWCRSIKEGDYVVDAGAHSGSYALPALVAGAYVLAFEPSDEGFKILRENFVVNGGAFIVDQWVRKEALWDGTEYPKELAAQVFADEHYPASELKTVRLDDDYPWWSEGLDWVKLDVEGAELGAVRGMLRLLERWKPTLLIELHQGVSDDPNDQVSRYPETVDSNREISMLLRGLGYAAPELVLHDVSRWYAWCAHPSRRLGN
jgi:FkbM family methyltransferase